MKLLLLVVTAIALVGCGSYNTVYYKNMGELREAFPDTSFGNVDYITDQHSKYEGYYKIKYVYEKENISSITDGERACHRKKMVQVETRLKPKY